MYVSETVVLLALTESSVVGYSISDVPDDDECTGTDC